MELQNNALAQQQADEANFHADARALWDNPTPQSVARLQALYPKHAASMKIAWGTMDDANRQRSITALGSALSRARVGDWDAAAKILRPWHEADLEAGQADPAEMEVMRIVESGTPEERAGLAGVILAQLSAPVGPDKIGDFWRDVHAEEREQEKHPFVLSQQASEAATKEAEAEHAPQYYDARADKEEAEARVAQSNSLWADLKNSANVAWTNARTSNIYSLIRKRASALGKRPQDVTAEEVAGPLRSKRRVTGGLSKGENEALDYIEGRGGREVIATDGKGNKVRFNRRTRKWEPMR
jgi:hypothetical protein